MIPPLVETLQSGSLIDISDVFLIRSMRGDARRDWFHELVPRPEGQIR